jgi:glycosyltransferase involved in cell wall biosynthesis
MRISLVITSYNQREYLSEAIESALSQTVPYFEIIVTDDGSHDGSQELIQRYAKRYPGLIRAHIQPKNIGIPRNRNSALERVRGDLVGILDGDDRLHAERNERQIAALREHSSARAVYSNMWQMDQQGERIELRYKTPQPSGNILAEVFAGKMGIMRTMLASYSDVNEVGFLDPDFWHYDGYELSLRLASQCSFVYVPEPLVEHRRHDKGYSQQILKLPAARLQELRGIFEKDRHLLSALPRAEALWAERRYLAWLSKMEGKLAWRQGQRRQALITWWRGLRKNGREFITHRSM